MSNNLVCFGRNSGTELGWMMFENGQDTWEEKAEEWNEILDLSTGKTEFKHKFDGRIAQAA